jgi:hypothetical protein
MAAVALTVFFVVAERVESLVSLTIESDFARHLRSPLVQAVRIAILFGAAVSCVCLECNKISFTL